VGSPTCQWFITDKNVNDVTEDWAKEFCISQGQMRQTGNTTWVRADAKQRKLVTYDFSEGLVSKFLSPDLLRDPAPFGEPGIEFMQPFSPDAVPNIPSPPDYSAHPFMAVLLNPRFRSQSNVLYYYKRYSEPMALFSFDSSLVPIQSPVAPLPRTVDK
jgi:hypothetical protein